MLNYELMLSVIPDLMKGVALTGRLALLILVFALALAVPVALARNSPRRAVARGAATYILFFRGVPALVQIYLVYYGLGQFQAVRTSLLWPILRDPVWCLVIALALNGSAYTGELLAGAMRAVPRGQVEAGRALGLTRWQSLRLIVIPMAARAALPAYSNEVILTVKATSLASTITLMDLTGAARLAVSQTYAPYEVFLVAGFIYFCITFALSSLLRRVEGAIGYAPT